MSTLDFFKTERYSLGRSLPAILFIVMALCLTAPAPASAEIIGSVDTVFHMFSRDDDIIVEAFDDPDIPGVTCYLSRARKGGVKGMVGVAEDPSDASIECVKTGPIKLPEDVKNGKKNGKRVFKKGTSLVFKSMQVVRFYDADRGVLVYMVYSDRMVEGSPKNSITCIKVD